MTIRVEHIGPHTLYLGDCREIMPTVGAVQCVVTDPPYGIAYVTSFRHVSDAPAMLHGDDAAPIDTVRLMMEALQPGGAIYLCTRQDVSEAWRRAIIDAGGEPKTSIIWDKTNHTAGDLEGDYGAQTELILFAHKGRHKLRGGRDVNLWRIPRPTFGNHPTPKPVDLMGRAIRNSTDWGDTVMDPFMGEGPTAVACQKLGRRFIGIEIEPRYFDAARKRLEAAMREPDLFIAEPSAKTEARQLDLLESSE